MAHETVNTDNRGNDQRTQRDAPQDGEKKSNRGFASMDPAKQREIASKGGRAAHEKGTAHQFSANEAREAGRKGGGTVSQNRQHMAEIGRIGGQSRGRKQRAVAEQTEHSEESEKTDEPSGDPTEAQTHH
jgi:hypothetical protein